MTADAPPKAVPWPTKLGYGIGAVGGQIFRDTPAIILPIYMITVLGIPAWIAGLAILVPKAWIIFCDPLVGKWSDRRRVSWGRAPFLLAGALLSGLTFLMMFSAPSTAPTWITTLYMTFAFALASTAYSLFSVPYLSAASEMSVATRERTSIMAYRMAFLAVGVAIGAGYALPVAKYFGGNWDGFQRMGLIYGSVCLLTMLVSFVAVRGARMIAAPPITAVRATRGDLATLRSNKPFVILTSAYFIALTGQAITYTVFGLYFLVVLKAPDALVAINLPAAASVVVAQPVTLWLTRHWCKRTIYIIGIVGWSALSLSWLTAGPAETAAVSNLLGIPVHTNVLLGVRGFFWGMFNAVYVLMALSMLTDTIAADRDRSGCVDSGLFSGVFSAVEKVGFALGPAIAGVLLSLGGFIEDRSGGREQSESAITTLVLCFTVIPATFKLLSLLVLRHYRLTVR